MTISTLGGGASWAKDISDQGQVVGSSTTGDDHEHAFSWTPAGGIIDLGALGGSYSFATAVNESGVVVGAVEAAGVAHAFLWTASDGMVDLGTLVGWGSSAAVAVNDSGQVVGWSDASEGRHAFSWTANGGMVDLGTLGGRYSEAWGLNARGQVVGYSTTATGASHAVLWSPPDTDTTPPDLTVTVTPNLLWPPNHKYVTVQATVTATDDSGAPPVVTVDSFTSNEPDDAPGNADGITTSDIVQIDDYTFTIRAERDETGTGRTYTITYRATDGSGNAATQSVNVSVPVR